MNEAFTRESLLEFKKKIDDYNNSISKTSKINQVFQLMTFSFENYLKFIFEQEELESPTLPDKTNDALSGGCGKMFSVIDESGGGEGVCGKHGLCGECKLKVAKRGKGE